MNFASLLIAFSDRLSKIHSVEASSFANRATCLEDWERVNLIFHKGSCIVSVQKNRFKPRSQWYGKPLIVHNMFPSSPRLWWWYRVEDSTMLHIWLSGPTLQRFWPLVHSHIRSILTSPMDYSPAQYPTLLLHYSPNLTPKYWKSFAMHVVNSARTCIPALWKSSWALTLWDWYLRLNKICDIEELVHTAQETYRNFYNILTCRLAFRNSAECW